MKRFVQAQSHFIVSLMAFAILSLLTGCKSSQRTGSEISKIIDFGSTLIDEGGNPLGLFSWIGGLTMLGGAVAMSFTRGSKGIMALLIGLGMLLLNFALARFEDWMLIPILLAVAAVSALYTYCMVRKKPAGEVSATNLALPDEQAAAQSLQANLADTTKVAFRRQLPAWAVVLVSCLLVSSLVLNIIALLPSVAFIEMFGVMMAGPYSILDVVHMLWEHGLYPLAFLVIGFSVIFPPVKIALATWAFTRPMTAKRRKRVLGTLGQLGRWSLLDVFVALLLLIITSKQSLAGATVNIGLYAFLGAIMMSMTAVAIMHEFNRRLRQPEPTASDGQSKWAMPMLVSGGPRAWAMLPLLFVAFMCLEMAINLPLFQIERFGLMSNTWSLWTSIGELHSDGLNAFATFMMVVLLIAPASLVVIAAVVLLMPVRKRHKRWLYITMHNVYEWCMLDVFALAMLLYLGEERNFAHLDLKAGLWYLFGSMVLFHVVMYVMVSLVRRETDPDSPPLQTPPRASDPTEATSS